MMYGWTRRCMGLCRTEVVRLGLAVVIAFLCSVTPVHGQDDINSTVAQGLDFNLTITFIESPANDTSNTTAVFRFVTLEANSTDPCGKDCTIQCQLDSGPFQNCSSREISYKNLSDGIHQLSISVIATRGVFFTAKYDWTVDTVPPTCTLDAGPGYTNAVNVSVDIVFTESCAGEGGFQCNSTVCNLYVIGPATVLPSTLQVIEPGLNYTITIVISTQDVSGKLFVTMQEGFCTDAAGNLFKRRANSSFTIHFDRSVPTLNLWTPIPESQLQINDQYMTIQATNNPLDLLIYLDFSESMATTNEQLLSSLETSVGNLTVANRKSRGNRRFAFQLINVPTTAIVTVTLPGNSTFSRYGTPVTQTAVVYFLYDTKMPQATVTTSSLAKTKNRIIPFLIQFDEPVFQFDSSNISISGGNLTRFTEVSKGTYTAEVYVWEDKVVSVSVPSNVTSDIAGNANLASNEVRVRHYTVPASAVALYSFTTAGLIATALASGALSISSATLAAAGALTSTTAGSITADPSRNLLGMATHLQVFALSDWLAASLPVEYRETTRGLRWLIPHVNPPFQNQHSYLSVNDPLVGSTAANTRTPVMKYHASLGQRLFRGSVFTHAVQRGFGYRVFPHRGRMLDVNSTQYGPAVTANDYKLYFMDQSGNDELRSVFYRQKYTGWRDFARNMFWLGAVGGGIILLHLLLILFLRLRTKTSVRGALTFPRFELFLLILAIPCMGQASAFIIRGGTTEGIIIGVLLLAVPASFLLSVALFLTVAVFTGSLVQYKEILYPSYEEEAVPWRSKLLAALAGPSSVSKWVRKDGLAPTFLPRYGLLFEDCKGPPKLILVDSENGGSFPKWIDSGSNGIGRMRAVNSDDESEEAAVSCTNKFLGGGRSAYILVDLSRRICLGLIFGAYARSDRSWSQISIALGFTVAQLLYLFILKPFIKRGVQAVESVSLLCETGLFVAALVLLGVGHPSDDHLGIGIVMLAFLLISFVCQLVNEWYALMKQLLRLSPTQEPSLKAGLKMLGKGFVLPFVPRGHWSKFIAPQPLQMPRTGLVPVVPPSPEPELERARGSTSVQHGSPLIAMGPEPVAPRYDPGSPSFVDPRNVATHDVMVSGEIKPEVTQKHVKPAWSTQWSRSRSLEGKRSRGSKSDPKSSELKILRELAKASFPRWRKQDEATLDAGLEISSPVHSNQMSGRRKHSASAPSRVGGAEGEEDRAYTDDSLSDGSSDEGEAYQRPHLVGESSLDVAALPIAATPHSSGSFEKGSKESTKGSGNLEQMASSLPLREVVAASRNAEER